MFVTFNHNRGNGGELIALRMSFGRKALKAEIIGTKIVGDPFVVLSAAGNAP